ncbi:hypothetical protein [Xanthomonas bonasiae]|uniref:hypothetical protein n=1 Tax=Xanthomonas bonasiae TaxID=2810351 RepID=UPI00177B074A|nr:hypothetical protein [Xanthomonas surreyensis]MBD7920338.1 hypothetical protein [Xanthomonas surreyensis]
MFEPAPATQVETRPGPARWHGLAAALWGIVLTASVYLGLIRPAPLFAGSGSLPEPLLPWLGALALLVLATTPSAWRWFYLRRRQARVGGPVRVAAHTGRVALLCPLSIGAWLCCRQLNTQLDSGGTLAALSVLYLASALLTLSSARHWLVKRWRGR